MTPADERLPELLRQAAETYEAVVPQFHAQNRKMMKAHVAAIRDAAEALESRAPVVSEAAVEAAGLAYEVELEGAVYGPGVPRESMRAALTAALPHLLAASPAKPEVRRGE